MRAVPVEDKEGFGSPELPTVVTTMWVQGLNLRPLSARAARVLMAELSLQPHNTLSIILWSKQNIKKENFKSFKLNKMKPNEMLWLLSRGIDSVKCLHWNWRNGLKLIFSPFTLRKWG